MRPPNGNGAGEPANISFTKFLFIIPRSDDDAARARLRVAGGFIGRGFFNDFDADGTREVQPGETLQFLVADTIAGSSGVLAARYVLHLSANYRPRLREVEDELRRRLGDHATIIAVDGAVRQPRYTSAEMHDFAYKRAVPRMSGRIAPNAIILPISKTDDWWQKPPLERHAYFYPHVDGSGCPIKGHARAAEGGVTTLFRRLYHNPDGYRREHEYDFITYFECRDEHLATFGSVLEQLRDTRQNPEWRFVLEGPEWRGRRVLRW